MKQENLIRLGLKGIPEDMPIYKLFDHKLSLETLELTKATKEKLSIIRDIITEYNRSIPKEEVTSIKSAVDVVKALYHTYKGLDHEECWIIYLNRANKIINKEMITSGGISSTLFDNQLILKHALILGASGIIVTHNHPSGCTTPSRADIQSTSELKKACAILDIQVVDHVILSDTTYYSFVDENEEIITEDIVTTAE